MGILYAKVGGSWVPIINSSSTGITQAEGDVRYVNIDGDTMTGALSGTGATYTGRVTAGTGAAETMPMRLFGAPTNGPRINFEASGLTQAMVGRTSSGFEIDVDQAQTLILDAAATQVRGPFTVVSSPGFTAQLRSPVGTAANAESPYISFVHSDATTRFGYVQGRGAGTTYPGMQITADGSQPIYFMTNGVNCVMIDGNSKTLTVGKITTTIADTGLMGIVGPASQYWAATSEATTPALILNKVGAGVAATTFYESFRLDNTEIGKITRNASTSAVLYTTSSDYRLKNDRGLITNALERIKVLKPRRITWKEDPDEQEQDAFFAHEVAEVVPEAVTGEKDAVADTTDEDAGTIEGAIIPQGLDPSRLIPLLVAAVQELAAEVAALKAQLA